MRLYHRLAFVAVATLFLSGSCVSSAQAVEKTLQRVQRTHIIRCGYVNDYPFTWYNGSRRAVEGIIPEYLEKVFAPQKLRVQWSMEVDPKRVPELLKQGRIDIMCSPTSYDPTTMNSLFMAAQIGNRLFYSWVGFASQYKESQARSLRIGYIDDEATRQNAERMFPDTRKHVRLPATATSKDLFDGLRYAKYDVAIADDISAQMYLKANPRTLRKYLNTLIFLKPLYIALMKEESQWQGMVKEDLSADNADNNALLKSLASKYGLPNESLVQPFRSLGN